MEPAPAISTCMRASLNWRVRCTHASLPPLALFIIPAARYFKQINAFACRCDHQHFFCKTEQWEHANGKYRPLTHARHLHVSGGVYQMWSAFPKNFCPSAHIGGQVLMSEGQTCSLGTAFTSLRAPYCVRFRTGRLMDYLRSQFPGKEKEMAAHVFVLLAAV